MKVRETEIELLRIVVMILIIITHLAVWGTAKQITQRSYNKQQQR